MPKATRSQDPRNGKLVATWKWASKSGRIVEIPVRMSADTSDGPLTDKKNRRGRNTLRHRITDKVQLGVFLDKPKKIEVVGTDIEVIRKTVFTLLGGVYELDWKPYYIVKLDSTSYFDETGAGMRLEYESIEMAEEDGRWMWRHPHLRGYEVYEGKPKTGQDGEEMVAVVEATEENDAALEAICEQLNALREHVGKFLAPDQIDKTLRTAVQRLLPVPK